MPFAHVLFKYGHSVRRRCTYTPEGGKNQGNGPGENRNTRRTITALSRLVEPKDGDDGRGAHARAHLTHLLSQTSGLATVIRPLVLVSVVRNIGGVHVLGSSETRAPLSR